MARCEKISNIFPLGLPRSLTVTLELILRESLVDILRAATSSAPDEVLPL